MSCRLLVTTTGPGLYGGPPETQTLSLNYSTQDDALIEAKERLRLEKKRTKRGTRSGVVLLQLRIECDDGSVMEDDAIRRATLFFPD